jgi:biopolymer transport protein ExbD
MYLKTEPITLDKLQQKLVDAMRENPKTTLAINADTAAPWGQIVKVMEAAKAAHIPIASAFTKAAK